MRAGMWAGSPVMKLLVTFFFEVFRGYLEGFASEKRYIEAKYYFALCSFCV